MKCDEEVRRVTDNWHGYSVGPGRRPGPFVVLSRQLNV